MGEGSSRLHVGIALPELAHGGAERVSLLLARSLIERGHRVDLYLLRFAGSYRSVVPDGVRLYHRRRRDPDRDLARYCRERGIDAPTLTFGPVPAIAAWRRLRRQYPALRIRWPEARAALGVAAHLRAARPRLLLAVMPPATTASLLAARLAQRHVPVVAAVHNNLSLSYTDKEKSMARALVPEADAVVAVSHGVTSEVVKTLEVDAGRVHTIYNPVAMAEIRRLARREVTHSWFGAGERPVILTALREVPQKDWATLVEAFGRVRRAVPARLVVMGRFSEAYKARLTARAAGLGVEPDLGFLDFDENPFRYMRRARLFVLSSRWEGLPTVLIEALACGTQVVSTDTPHGPAEILEGGRWGGLSPVGDPCALAAAIVAALRGERVPEEELRRRAGDFSEDRAAAAYEALFDDVVGRRQAARSASTAERGANGNLRGEGG